MLSLALFPGIFENGPLATFSASGVSAAIFFPIMLYFGLSPVVFGLFIASSLIVMLVALPVMALLKKYSRLTVYSTTLCGGLFGACIMLVLEVLPGVSLGSSTVESVQGVGVGLVVGAVCGIWLWIAIGSSSARDT